jgi:glutamate-1-semialdehyde 2,1-aminomutase
MSLKSSNRSEDLIARASAKIPGGVNSPVRAWRAVGGTPRLIARASGPYVFDINGNRMIDYVGAYGPAIIGHADPRIVAAISEQAAMGLGYGATTENEIILAEMICAQVPSVSKIRLVSSGTEAGMTAIRIARAATGRKRIIKFDGCYHGHSDAMLVRSGSGAMTLGVPNSAGVPDELANLTMVARYNSLEDVNRCFATAPGEVAAVIVESLAANMGVVPPAEDFLAELGAIAHRNGALLICDEVITGFRLCFGAYCERLRADADLLMFGKVIGGGMPIGAVGGRAELMDLLAPAGPVYQAGTLSGNPLSVRAGIETLRILAGAGSYDKLEMRASRLARGLREALARSGYRGVVNQVGSILTIFFGVERVNDADSARRADQELFAKFFHRMLERGIHLAPSQFEAMFVSLAHGDEEIELTISAATEALASLNG